MRSIYAKPLSDYPHNVVRMICLECRRQCTFDRDMLMEILGPNVTMVDVLGEIVSPCPRWTGPNVENGGPCEAMLPDLREDEPPRARPCLKIVR